MTESGWLSNGYPCRIDVIEYMTLVFRRARRCGPELQDRPPSMPEHAHMPPQFQPVHTQGDKP